MSKVETMMAGLDEAVEPTRKAARRQARQARRELARQAGKAGEQVRAIAEELAEAVAESPKRRRRRWPWLVALLVGGGAAAFVVLSRRPREVRLEDVPDDAPGAVPVPHPARNGQTAPHTADRGANN